MYCTVSSGISRVNLYEPTIFISKFVQLQIAKYTWYIIAIFQSNAS